MNSRYYLKKMTHPCRIELLGQKKFRNFRRNGLEMALAPDGRPPLVGMSACPASPRRRRNTLAPRYRGCATLRHKPGGRTLLPRKACLRRAAKTRQHALRGRAKPPCPEAPAPKGAAVLLGQGLFPRGLWFISLRNRIFRSYEQNHSTQ